MVSKQKGELEHDGQDDLWNRDYRESGIDAYRNHMETVVKPKYDLTNLTSEDIEPLLDELTESTTLSTPIPAYMLGGRQGGILWSGFKKHSFKRLTEAVAALSYLFNNDDHSTINSIDSGPSTDSWTTEVDSC